MTLVSVITITRNDLDGLRATVGSVRSQTHPNIEHVIIDAASADGTPEYLKTLGDAARYISEPDAGRYDGMNKGARLASGDLIWFMHARDVFASSSVIATAVSAYEHSKFRWAYGLARMVDAEGKPVGVMGNVPFNFARFALGGRPVPHQATVFEREFFWQMGGYSTAFGLAEDQHFMLRCALAERPKVFPEFFCSFDTTGVGSTRGVFPHYWDMARGRRSEGVKVLKLAPLDLVVSSLLAAQTCARDAIAKRSRTLGPSA